MNPATLRTLATAGTVAAATAVSYAGLALADPGAFSGKYTAAGSDQFYVTVSGTCATEGCTASLVSNRGWTSVATLTNGHWNFNVTKPDGVVCGDGSFADVVIRYSIDAATLTGVMIADSNGECPGGQITRSPIQLTKVG